MSDTLESAAEEDGRGKSAVKLTPDAFKRVIENFERKMSAEFFYVPLERNITYNQALVEQASMYRKLVEGSLQRYQPLALK